MGVSVVVFLTVVVYGSILGLGAVWIRRRFLRARADPDDTAEMRILDELDQLDVQVTIFNERLKRVEDESLLGPGEDSRTGVLNRGDQG